MNEEKGAAYTITKTKKKLAIFVTKTVLLDLLRIGYQKVRVSLIYTLFHLALTNHITCLKHVTKLVLRNQK